MDSTTERRAEHGGPLHAIRSKRDLAEHVGEEHQLTDGSRHRIVSPDAKARYRWSREELESTHRAMHEGGYGL